MPPDEPAGQNPPDGAILDYFLAQPAAGPVTIEILDAQGKLVRKFSSEDKPDQTQEELAKQLIPLYWIRPQKIISAEAGMHRWLWDLHYPSPVALHHEYPISAVPHDTPRYPLGPRALPGTYTVKLTAGGANISAPLMVRMDPRVKTPPEGLRALFQMQTSLADMMTRSSEAIAQARSAHEQLEKVSVSATAPVKEAIESLDKQIAAVLEGAPAAAAQKLATAGATPEPTLTQAAGNIAPLYSEIDRADAIPTPAQSHALATIEHDFGSTIRRWEALRSSDIPALNRLLKSASLPELHVESNMQPAEEAGDDEE
jgi:hypothetical protein